MFYVIWEVQPIGDDDKNRIVGRGPFMIEDNARTVAEQCINAGQRKVTVIHVDDSFSCEPSVKWSDE